MYTGLRRRLLSGWKARHKILENEYFGRRIRTGRLIRLIRLIQERFRVRDLKALFCKAPVANCQDLCDNLFKH